MSAVVPGRIADLAGEWDLLADRTGASPFLRAGWIGAWSTAFQSPVDLLVAREEGHVVGVLPVARDGRTVRSASNLESPVYGPVALTAGATRVLADALFEGRPRRVSLWMLPPEVADVVEAAAAAAGYRTACRIILRSPYVEFRGGWESYERTLDPKVRGEIRRRTRRLEEQGRVSIEVHEGSEGLEPLFGEGMGLEGSGWKDVAGTSIAARPRVRRLYEDVARWAADHGWLRLAFLRLDGRPLAFDYALEWGGTHALVKTGFDPAFRRWSPGLLLRREMLRRAHEEGLRHYEFLGHDDPWKLRWTTTVRERVVLDAFAPSVAGTAGWASERFGRPLARRARRATRAVLRR